MFDLIGDIHGHADELVALLDKLDYERQNGVFRHPSRRVVFLGDFIDRGPKIREALGIVRPMVDEGAALAIMGNHELNALAYHTERADRPGDFVRPHSAKNEHQHSATLRQLSTEEMASALAWFRTLPLWLDLGGVRAVHACWDDAVMRRLPQRPAFDAAFIHEACARGGPHFEDIEVLLKGREGRMPAGRFVRDKDGVDRATFRTRWYLPAANHTYRSYGMQAVPVECDEALSAAIVAAAAPYPASAPPVFVGHYWLTGDRPAPLAANVACLDYSVARGGFLCAYRWDGETVLSDAKFVWTSPPPASFEPRV